MISKFGETPNILVCPVGESQQKTDPLEKDFASTGKYVYYFQTYSFLCLPIHSSILFAKLCLGKQNITEYWEDISIE